MPLSVRSVVTGDFQENTYLLTCVDTRDAVLVDPGDDVPAIVSMVDAAGARPVAIWNTHAHLDHVMGVAALQAKWPGLPFLVSPGDDDWLESLDAQAAMFGLGDPGRPVRTGSLSEGDVLQVGRVEGRVIATPGHTAGGVCLWFPDDKVLVTGDTLFVGGVGRTDLPGGDFDTLERSIQRLYALPDDVTFFSGHGPPGKLGREKKWNPFVRAD